MMSLKLRRMIIIRVIVGILVNNEVEGNLGRSSYDRNMKLDLIKFPHLIKKINHSASLKLKRLNWRQHLLFLTRKFHLQLLSLIKRKKKSNKLYSKKGMLISFICIYLCFLI